MEVVGIEVLEGGTTIRDGSGQGGSGDLGLHRCRSW